MTKGKAKPRGELIFRNGEKYIESRLSDGSFAIFCNTCGAFVGIEKPRPSVVEALGLEATR